MTIDCRIHNIRKGFATNSSSSHSIIFLEGGAQDYDIDSGFNWSFFTAGSVEAKRCYIAECLHTTLCFKMEGDEAAKLVKEWLYSDFHVKRESYEHDGKTHVYYTTPGSVDHQSRISFPSNWAATLASREFVQDYQRWFEQPNIVVLGGNDNTDERHPLLDTPGVMVIRDLLQRDSSDFSGVARKDPKYGFWTLFNRENGYKARLSFQDICLKTPPPERATTPELVDLKITDYCPMGCAYCYQDSTLKGRHGDTQFLKAIIDKLADMQVFEVAMGGGETTLHPDFLELLEHARKMHVIPNFTTKRTDWLRDAGFCAAVMPVIGAFAFSAEDSKQMATLLRQCESADVNASKCTVQCVLGVVPDAELHKMMKLSAESGVRLTLLGYKPVGRGKKYSPLMYRKWLEMAQEVAQKHPYGFELGVDTVVAAQFEKELQAAGISKRFYHTSEGRFSMYIDGVARQCGPSSYEPESMGSFDDVDVLPDAFQSFA
jgi:hypothetical protein